MRELVRLGAALVGAGVLTVALPVTANAADNGGSAGNDSPGVTAKCPATVDPEIPGGKAAWKITCEGKGSRAVGAVVDTRKDGKDVCVENNKGDKVARTQGAGDKQNFEVSSPKRRLDLYLRHC